MVVGVKPDGAPVNYQDHIVGLDWSQRLLADGHARPDDDRPGPSSFSDEEVGVDLDGRLERPAASRASRRSVSISTLEASP